ncbi:type IV secretory system conjugative DNA transfer family protein [Vibrio coralliirubri]|uniref:type IV secretory system conjugative DNA transfer family protein n=1 Tax=Vibrio coralliirubri TaxID=1516159 RepID=UPI002283CE26|nr:type IV secretory system conjugative DNA transfer family protein [Vibrio coralliirubri]MCY9866131.1 type IV secretory system conjugative DNA transfer family protein [Vibrio coralliirubri]
MDNISTEDFGNFLPDREVEDPSVSRDDYRRQLKSFHADENIRKYILADEIGVSSYSDKDISLKGVLLFNTPSLEGIRVKAESSKDVEDRRKLQLEKETRANLIYNEAVRYGAQVALRNTLLVVQNNIEREASSLEANYNFSNYMLHKNTVVPPVINLSKDGIEVTDTKFSKFDYKYTIRQQAKFSSRVPHYRDYLSFQQYSVRDPSMFNIPLTPNELTHWMNGIYDGWKRGEMQAKIEIDNAISKLKLDFMGMVRYHMLLQKKMVSEPVITKSTLGLSGDKNDIEVGVINFVMDGAPVFELDMKNWTPLPMIDELEMKEFIKRKDEY